MANSETDLYRIIDVAANRTREGLRVIEDFVRFGMNDLHLSQVLKECRHEQSAILSQLSTDRLLAARDTLNDVGTTTETNAEYERRSPTDVVRAAFRRVQEALRTLEEYSKIIDARLAPRFEQSRYHLYTVEKAVLRTESSLDRLKDQKLYLLIGSSLGDNDFETVVSVAISAGVKMIQLREKSITDRELVHHARRLREITRQAGVLMIVNDRPDIAVVSNADGVHVGQDEFSVHDARSIVGPDRLVGVSTHSIGQARQAVLEGADYIGVGPTFPSGTKTFTDFPGLALLRQVAAEIRLPWFAIGGIDTDNVGEVAAAGGTRIAVSSAICRSKSPGEVAANLISGLMTDADPA